MDFRWSDRCGVYLTREHETMITMKGISKTYRVRTRDEGLGNAVKSLFSRSYTPIPALRDMTFTIPDGQIVGYIGPNGAGKSTTIKILSGILRPDSGECTVDGMVPWQDRKRYVSRLGVVFGQRSQLWWDVPVLDSFRLLQDIYRVPDRAFADNLERLTALLDLEDLLTSPVRTLSLGQRMRCEIACRLTPLRKLTRQLADACSGELSRFYRLLGERLHRGEEIPEAARAAAKACHLDFPKEVQHSLDELFDTFGKCDYLGQLRLIKFTQTQVAAALEQLTAEKKNRCRCYELLGVCAGFALAILVA